MPGSVDSYVKLTVRRGDQIVSASIQRALKPKVLGQANQSLSQREGGSSKRSRSFEGAGSLEPQTQAAARSHVFRPTIDQRTSGVAGGTIDPFTGSSELVADQGGEGEDGHPEDDREEDEGQVEEGKEGEDGQPGEERRSGVAGGTIDPFTGCRSGLADQEDEAYHLQQSACSHSPPIPVPLRRDKISKGALRVPQPPVVNSELWNEALADEEHKETRKFEGRVVSSLEPVGDIIHNNDDSKPPEGNLPTFADTLSVRTARWRDRGRANVSALVVAEVQEDDDTVTTYPRDDQSSESSGSFRPPTPVGGRDSQSVASSHEDESHGGKAFALTTPPSATNRQSRRGTPSSLHVPASPSPPKALSESSHVASPTSSGFLRDKQHCMSLHLASNLREEALGHALAGAVAAGSGEPTGGEKPSADFLSNASDDESINMSASAKECLHSHAKVFHHVMLIDMQRRFTDLPNDH
jgi:hypothetical protein